MEYYVAFLNGALRGRRLALPQSGLSLGSNDVDLIVSLEPGTERFSLIPEDGYVKVSEDVRCWVEGKEFTSSELPLDKVIDVAGQCFTISDKMDFPTPDIPDRIDSQKGIIAWLGKPSRLVGLLSFFLMIIVFSYIALSYHDFLRENRKEKAISDFIHQNEGISSDRSLHFVWNKDGGVNISGYCQHQDDLKYIQTWLLQHHLNYNVKTQCMDQLKDNVSYLLAQSGYSNFKITDGARKGEIILHGDFQDGPAWREIVNQLNGFEGLSAWHVSINQFNEFALLDAVKKAGVLGKVSVVKTSGDIFVNGFLDENQQIRLKKEILAIEQFDKPEITFQNVKSLVLDEDFFSAKIISVGGNSNSAYIELSDKTRLQQGARIKNGYVIAKIDPSLGIDVYKDNELIHYALSI